VAKASEVRNPFLLLRNVSFAVGNVPLGFFQMTEPHRASI
jgi:hypothetical protein